ncbi:MAG: hypothetical protein HN929_10295 [Chloroflexi bacterium]|jgi:hypothetical protein|nr:hypothetical protein [Candidatus Neomarinimicrobiota bacterium]MBT7081839.1 hypothetical protein [Chloroflexota bacterium]
MLPAPSMIYLCPHCSGLIEQERWASLNTHGARFWSDGRMIASMYPDGYQLILCPHCSNRLWMSELDEVDSWDKYYGEPSFGPDGEGGLMHIPHSKGYDQARQGKEPSFDDYMVELQEGVHDEEREGYLRQRAWWRGNDQRREGEQVPLSDQERDNLKQFLKMIDPSDDYWRVIAAEVNRELGQFQEALRLLFDSVARRHGSSVALIRELCLMDNPFVAEVPTEDRGGIVLG